MSAANPARERDALIACYQRGLRLMTMEKNHAYAHVLFAHCVVHEPANLQYVEALVKNLRDQHAGRKRRTVFSLRGVGRALRKSEHAQDWRSVIRLGIDALKSDPWEVSTLRTLAAACAAMHYNEVELVYLKQALDAEPKNVAVNRHCARSLGRLGQFDQAIACWHRVETLRGKDEEAARMISQLAEDKLKYPSGRPQMTQAASAKRAEGADVSERGQLEPVRALSPREQLERAIAEAPDNVANYLKLADLLIDSDKLHAAETALSRGVATCGNQPNLTEQLALVRGKIAELAGLSIAHLAADQAAELQPLHVPWLEVILALTVVGLTVQLYPAAVAAMWQVVDPRQWSRLSWFLANVFVLLLLCLTRFMPELRAFMHARRRRQKPVAKKR